MPAYDTDGEVPSSTAHAAEPQNDPCDMTCPNPKKPQGGAQADGDAGHRKTIKFASAGEICRVANRKNAR